jgi:hypothetical protein
LREFFLMDGRVKRPSHHSHFLCPGLWFLLLIVPILQGQTLYCTESVRVPQARYTSSSNIHMAGGDVYERGTIIGKGPRLVLEFAPFSEVSGINLTLTNTKLVGTNVTFRNCNITVANSGMVDLNACVLEGTKIGFRGASYANTTKPASAPMVEDKLSWVILKNSILSDVQLTYERPVSVHSLEGTFQLEQCSFYGPTCTIPAVPMTENFLEYVKQNELKLKACRFLGCNLGTAMLAISEDCIFEVCQPGTEGQVTTIPGVKDLPIKATFLPAATSAEISAKFPQVRFTSASSGQIGSSVPHTIAEGVVTMRYQSPVGSLRENFLPSMLPLTTPKPSMANAPVPGGGGTNPNPTPASTRPERETVFMGNTTGTMGSPDSPLKIKQTSVNGLLIMSLASGEAGSASKMSAIALSSSDARANATVSFNQPVGEMMGKALQEVTKFTQLNCGGWPKGHSIEISFADKYSNKDGPSAAVACALLLHSLITGKELDPAFAVTGDMNSDGSVQPIGGVPAKIRGATKGQCKLIGIPSKNESSLGDLLLMDGPAPFASIQIFSIGTFREVEALALAQKPDVTQAAIVEMNQVQEVLTRNPAQIGAWLKNQHVIAKLQQVLKNSPNNLSAKYLLMYASGKVPQTLSLAGSLTAIDHTAGDLIAAIKANKGDSFDSMGKSSIGSTLTRLQSLRARCDVRTRPYADAIINFGAAVKEAMDRPAQTGPRALEYRNKILGAGSAVDSVLSRLLNDPAVREELEG